jgi:Lrp/AsnC family transcriptional regulator, leucine-responsive regulatory protein
MIKLDKKDRKLLYELDLNSRQSYHKLAKKIGLSKDSVIYRIKKLQAEGVIKQFHTIIDTGKLGYTSFRLYLDLVKTTPKDKDDIINYLKSKKCVTWMVSIDGSYDLGIWVLTKSVKEMNNFWKELHEKYNKFLGNVDMSVFTKVSYFPRSYLLEKKYNDKEFAFITEPEELKIDGVDFEILKLIAPNARIKITEIASKLDLTTKTIISRIKELERKNIIIGYRTLFDLEKLGYQYFKVHFVLQDYTKEQEREFRNYIKQHPNIIYDNEVLGGSNIEIEIQVKDLVELRGIIGEIQTKFFKIIEDYKQMSFYEEHKFVFLPES